MEIGECLEILESQFGEVQAQNNTILLQLSQLLDQKKDADISQSSSLKPSSFNGWQALAGPTKS